MDYRPRLPYSSNIQGLRGLAVLLVVFCHAGVPVLQGGFVGVDVFFVLSGYLITGLLLSEYRERGAIRFGAFLARRLRRLLPALAAMIGCVAYFGASLLSGYEFSNQSQSLVYAITWTSNFFFAFRELDYFAALQSRDLFLHTWSLGVEEQFYIVWPLLLAVTLGIASRQRPKDPGVGPLPAVLTFLAIGSFALCVYWAQNGPLLSFYMMPSRVWQFALGGLVFLLTARGEASLVSRWSDVSPMMSRRGVYWLGVGMIVSSAVFLDERVSYPGVWAMLPTLGAAAALAAEGGREEIPGHPGLGRSVMVWFGDRSYSIYLWHWPVLLLGLTVMPTSGRIATIVSLLTALVLAQASYRFIELPFWKGRFNSLSTMRTVVASAVLVAATGLAGFGAADVQQENAGRPVWAAGYDPRQDAPPIYTAGFRCDTGHLTDELEPCSIGPADAPNTVVVLGDSIGAQWVSVVPKIYSPPTWQVIVLTKSACPIVDEDYFYSRIGDIYTVCSSWRARALEHIAALRPDLVIVGSDAEYPFSESQWTAGSARILATLSGVAQKVAVIPGTPTLSFDGPSCLEEPDKFELRTGQGRRYCEEARIADEAHYVAHYLRAAAGPFPNVTVLTLDDIVCPGGFCAAMTKDGSVVFRDNKHVTDSFAVARAPTIRRRLSEAGLGP